MTIERSECAPTKKLHAQEKKEECKRAMGSRGRVNKKRKKNLSLHGDMGLYVQELKKKKELLLVFCFKLFHFGCR